MALKRLSVTLAPQVPRRRKAKVMTTPPVTLVRWQVMLLLPSIAASGLSLVAAQQMRSLHSALDVLQSAQDRQMAEYSRLLLERVCELTNRRGGGH